MLYPTITNRSVMLIRSCKRSVVKNTRIPILSIIVSKILNLYCSNGKQILLDIMPSKASLKKMTNTKNNCNENLILTKVHNMVIHNTIVIARIFSNNISHRIVDITFFQLILPHIRSSNPYKDKV